MKGVFNSNIICVQIKFQTYGQESKIVGSSCNKHGIRVLKFSDPIGPVYHYEAPTNVTLGDQPDLRDPLENKYMYIKKSEFKGEGAFAARDLPPNLIYAQYAGFLYTGKDINRENILSEKDFILMY